MMRYTDARHAVGEFILREQDNLYNYTIADIAERTYTSKATVTRFAKSMGYDGWREFMKDYTAEIRHEHAHDTGIDYNFPFDENSSRDEIMNNLKKLQSDTIAETADLIDKDVLDKAVKYLKDAGCVVIFGASPNIYLGELFRRKLNTIGKSAYVAVPGETGISAVNMSSGDCAIIISYSGNSPQNDPLDKLNVLKRNGVNIIGITSGGDNYLRQHVKCVFTMVSRERLYTKVANFSTEESIQYILNVLYSCLFAEDFRANKNYKILNSRLLEQSRHTKIKSISDRD